MRVTDFLDMSSKQALSLTSKICPEIIPGVKSKDNAYIHGKLKSPIGMWMPEDYDRQLHTWSASHYKASMPGCIMATIGSHQGFKYDKIGFMAVCVIGEFLDEMEDLYAGPTKSLILDVVTQYKEGMLKYVLEMEM